MSVYYGSENGCPEKYKHTPCPPGYVEWHLWAEKKERTHFQILCPSCKRYVIWVPHNSND